MTRIVGGMAKTDRNKDAGSADHHAIQGLFFEHPGQQNSAHSMPSEKNATDTEKAMNH